jgi:hypothetical protein
VEKNSGLNHFFKTRIVSIHTVPQNALILPLWNPTVDANSAWLCIAGSTVGFPADDTPPEIKMILTYYQKIPRKINFILSLLEH